MAITFNHNDKLYVSGSNVGIGTDSPTSILHLENAGNTWAKFINTSGTNQRLDVGTNSSSQHFVFGYGDYPVLFGSNGAERMRITSDGRIGIGTTNPGAGVHIYDVNGAADLKLQRITGYPSNMHFGFPSGLPSIRTSGNFAIKASDAWGADFYISSSGNVGIGTTSPSYKLHVVGDVRADDLISSVSSGGTLWFTRPDNSVNTDNVLGMIKFGNSGDTGYENNPQSAIISGVASAAWSTTSTPSKLQFYTTAVDATTATERLIITSEGNVGIGTDSPNGKLDIVLDSIGGLKIDTNSDGGATITTYQGSTNSNVRQIEFNVQNFQVKTGIPQGTSTTDALFIDSSQNVGIGTTSPDLKLHLAHSDGNNGLLLEHTSQASGFQVLQNIRETEGLIWQRWANGAFASNLMTLTYSGELGIGTTSPDQKLQIHDSSSTGVYLHVTNSTTGEDGGNGALFGISSNEEALVWNYENTATRFSTNGTERMRIDSSGNVGIGTTSPSTALTISKPIDSSAYGSGTKALDFKVYYPGYDEDTIKASIYVGVSDKGTLNTQGGYLAFMTSNDGTLAERLRIEKNGNVGIGTNNPADKLDVTDGNAKMVFGAASSDRPWLYFQHNAVPVDGEEVGLLDFRGYNDASQDTRYVILTAKAEDVTDGSEDGSLTFGTMKDGTSTQTLTMRSGDVGIGTATPNAKLDVNGVVSLKTGSDSAYSIGVLEITSGGTPTQIKITTAIPFGGTTNAHSVTIKGFQYGSANTANLQISWHVYNNSFYNRTATSSGGWAPTIRLAVENGYVVIHLTSPGYWPKLYVESLYNAYGGTSHAQGWSWADAAINSDTNTPNEVVPYKVDFGNGFAMTSSGNVGIGTTSPATKLHILQSGTAVSSDGVSSLVVQKSAAAATAAAINIVSGDSAEASLRFGDTTDQSMGALRYLNDVDAFSIVTNNNEQVRITSGGNVGIGTSSPGAKLDVNSGISTSSTDVIKLTQATNGANKAAASLGLSIQNGGETTNAADLWFTTATGGSLSERMRITSGGNVGIGTTSPGSKFVVNNNGGTGSTFYVDAGNIASTQTLFEHTGSSTPVPFAISKSGYSGSSAAFGILYLDMAHNVAGGGANMYFTLRDSNSNVTEYGGLGATIVTNTDGSEAGRLNFYTTNGGSLRLNRMVISPDGNVGIGTTSPAFKLDVDGSVNLTGFYFNGINQAAGIEYTAPLISTGTYSRDSTNNASDEWVKVISYSGSPRRIRLWLNHGGDNTNMYDEYLISHSSYGMQTHIYRLPGSKYNTSKVLGIKAINSSGAVQDVWVKIAGITSGSGNFIYRANVSVQDSTNVAASSQSTEPTGTTGDSTLYVSANDRNNFTTMSSGGAYFGRDVGIGTSTPSGILHIAGTSYQDAPASGVGTHLGSSIRYGSDTNYRLDYKQIVSSGIVKHSYNVVNNGTSYDNMLVLDRGNVGIGTASPGDKLDVNGVVLASVFKSRNFSSTVQGFSIESGDSTVTTYRFDADRLRFYSGNYGELVSIKEDGNLGLGVTSPSQRLTVNGNIQGYDDLYLGADKTSGATILQINNYDAALTDAEDIQNVIKMQGRYWSGNNSQLIQTEIRSVKERSNGNGDSGLAFATQDGGNGPSEKMRIAHDGNVGIGTSGPIDKLQVNGNLFVTSKIYNGSSNDSAGITFPSSTTRIDGYNGITFHASSTNVGVQSERMRITSAGNVGIGTTAPQQALHIKGTTNGLMMLEGDNDNGIAGCYYKTEDTDNTMNRTKGFFGFQGNNTWGLGYFTMWLDNVGDNGTVTSSEERFRWERDGDFHADGDVIAYSTTTPSDIRLKTDVETIESASEKVSKLRGVEYTWSKGKLAGQREIGLIAQEVEAVVPEVVKEKELPLWDDSGESYKTVDYEKLVALLIESNKEMQEEIKQLKERLDGFTK